MNAFFRFVVGVVVIVCTLFSTDRPSSISWHRMIRIIPGMYCMCTAVGNMRRHAHAKQNHHVLFFTLLIPYSPTRVVRAWYRHYSRSKYTWYYVILVWTEHGCWIPGASFHDFRGLKFLLFHKCFSLLALTLSRHTLTDDKSNNNATCWRWSTNGWCDGSKSAAWLHLTSRFEAYPK